MTGHIILPKLRVSSRKEIEERIAKYGTISEAEFRKLCKEASKCQYCAGRPILHMRMCRQVLKKKVI